MGRTGNGPVDVDRGSAWMILLATYMGMVLYSIALFLNGVLYVALLERFGESEAKTTLVGAISIGIFCFGAPIGGILNNKFNCRVSIVAGGCLASLGLFASAFVPSLNWTVLTAGVVAGFGYSISSAGLTCCMGFYFERWREQVISGASTCMAVAMIFSAPLGLYLINTYGYALAMSILACTQAQMCVIGTLCKPSSVETSIKTKKKSTESGTKLYIDFSLLLQKSYFSFLCSTAAWNFGFASAIMHLPNYISKIGGTARDISFLMAAFSVANIIGRLCGSLTVSKFPSKGIHVHAAVLCVTGILTALIVVYSKFPGGIYFFAVQLGVLIGLPNGMMINVSLHFVGVEKLSEAYGLVYIACGIGITSGPIVIGYLFDATESYEMSFVVAGIVLFVGAFLGMAATCCKGNQKGRNIDIYEDTNEKYSDLLEPKDPLLSQWNLVENDVRQNDIIFNGTKSVKSEEITADECNEQCSMLS